MTLPKKGVIKKGKKNLIPIREKGGVNASDCRSFLANGDSCSGKKGGGVVSRVSFRKKSWISLGLRMALIALEGLVVALWSNKKEQPFCSNPKSGCREGKETERIMKKVRGRPFRIQRNKSQENHGASAQTREKKNSRTGGRRTHSLAWGTRLTIRPSKIGMGWGRALLEG